MHIGPIVEHMTTSETGSECRECGKELGAGYLCDECDTVNGWGG